MRVRYRRFIGRLIREFGNLSTPMERVMPLLTTCVLGTSTIGVEEALRLRDAARAAPRPRPDFWCGTCAKPVGPHNTSGHGGAHFEHLERNPRGPHSDPAW